MGAQDSGRFWPWQVKVTGCTVRVFETPQLLAEIIGGIEEIGLKKAQKMVSFYGLEIVQLLEEGSSCLQPWESKEADEKSRRKIKRTQGKRRPESVPASLWSE